MAEVRTLREGTLWWVQASGSGNVWATASAPQSGLFGYVQSMTFTSAQTLATISERGTPTHHKVQSLTPLSINPTFLWTGYHPSGISASGASLPLFHLEYKAAQPEINGSGRYFQFYGAALQQYQFTEQAAGDQFAPQFMCLGMSGENNTGYLS